MLGLNKSARGPTGSASVGFIFGALSALLAQRALSTEPLEKLDVDALSSPSVSEIESDIFSAAALPKLVGDRAESSLVESSRVVCSELSEAGIDDSGLGEESFSPDEDASPDLTSKLASLDCSDPFIVQETDRLLGELEPFLYKLLSECNRNPRDFVFASLREAYTEGVDDQLRIAVSSGDEAQVVDLLLDHTASQLSQLKFWAQEKSLHEGVPEREVFEDLVFGKNVKGFAMSSNIDNDNVYLYEKTPADRPHRVWQLPKEWPMTAVIGQLLELRQTLLKL